MPAPPKRRSSALRTLQSHVPKYQPVAPPMRAIGRNESELIVALHWLDGLEQKVARWLSGQVAKRAHAS